MMLVSVSVQHYAEMAVKLIYVHKMYKNLLYTTCKLLISDHEISVKHNYDIFQELLMLFKPIQLALDQMICV